MPPWVAQMKKPRQDHAAGLPIGCEAGMRRPRRGLTRLPAIGSVTCARKDPLASRALYGGVAREAGELLFALIHTVRSGCQTTVDRRGGRRCICETATELSSAAWIIGQRNRAALCWTGSERRRRQAGIGIHVWTIPVRMSRARSSIGMRPICVDSR